MSFIFTLLLKNSGFCSGRSCYFRVDDVKTYNDAKNYCSGKYNGKLFEPLSTKNKYNQVVDGLRRKYGSLTRGWIGIVENNGNWIYESSGSFREF